MLAVYPQATSVPGAIQLWIGQFDTARPLPPQVSVDQAPAGAAVQVLLPPTPIRDAMRAAPGSPANHRSVVRISGLAPGESYTVRVDVGGESRSLSVRTLPSQLPRLTDGGFNIFLCSCYYQPEDASGTFGNVINKILMRPDLTFMMGDQIYGDLPLDIDWPGGASIANLLGGKYIRNFASRALESGGLSRVLQRSPVVCVADDHEYWNNYPFRQAQLPNTWTKVDSKAWKKAAMELYEDYQLGPGLAPGFAFRLDIDPLKILVLDTRSLRDEGFVRLLDVDAEKAFNAWMDDLLAARTQGRPAFGLLSSGQALFAKATEESKRERADAELSNWTQFDDLLVAGLEKLADGNVPVIYVTGDVHWGRVSQGRSPLKDSQPMIHEVICSPSTLIRVPVVDRAKEAWQGFQGIFGKAGRWPRHSLPDNVPDRLGKSMRFALECKVGQPSDRGFKRQGDQVAMLTIGTAGGGIDFRVTYFEVSAEATGATPERTPIYSMRNL